MAKEIAGSSCWTDTRFKCRDAGRLLSDITHTDRHGQWLSTWICIRPRANSIRRVYAPNSGSSKVCVRPYIVSQGWSWNRKGIPGAPGSWWDDFLKRLSVSLLPFNFISVCILPPNFNSVCPLPPISFPPCLLPAIHDRRVWLTSKFICEKCDKRLAIGKMTKNV